MNNQSDSGVLFVYEIRNNCEMEKFSNCLSNKNRNKKLEKSQIASGMWKS